MYCTKCGAKNPKGTNFCIACGCDLSEAHSITAANKNDRRISRGKKPLIAAILGSVVAVVAVVMGVLFGTGVIGKKAQTAPKAEATKEVKNETTKNEPKPVTNRDNIGSLSLVSSEGDAEKSEETRSENTEAGRSSIANQDYLSEAANYATRLAELLDEEDHEEYKKLLVPALKAFKDARTSIDNERQNADSELTDELNYYDRAIENAEDIVVFEQGFAELQAEFSKIHNSDLDGAEYLLALRNANENMRDEVLKLKAPQGANGIIARISKISDPYIAAIDQHNSNDSLRTYLADSIEEWAEIKENAIIDELNALWVRQYEETARAIKEGRPEGSNGVTIEYTIIDEIYPNLYPSLDSVSNIYAYAVDDNQEISIEASIPNFSQKFKQLCNNSTENYKLVQGVNYLQVKPSPLPGKQIQDINKTTDIQINLKVVNTANGQKLAEESKQIKKYSIYDINYYSNEFGTAERFNILAWLRSDSEEVSAVIKEAQSYFLEWTGEPSMAGYQFKQKQLLFAQIAAIQRAISERGVTYQMDGFSFDSTQRVLTPDMVLTEKHGLCIETTLLMASCLQQLGLNVMLVFPQGHAQVAVETGESSGEWYIVETTALPYEVDQSYKIDNLAFYQGLIWTLDENYERVGIITFVLDCDMAPVMNIRGLDVT